MGGDARVPAALVLAAALLSCGRPASTGTAVPDSRSDPCSSAATQTELTACWGTESRRAESDAREAYDRIAAVLRERSDAEALNALVKAEAAWSTYREEQCAAAAIVFGDGSLGPMQGARCRAELAQDHGRILSSLLSSLAR